MIICYKDGDRPNVEIGFRIRKERDVSTSMVETIIRNMEYGKDYSTPDTKIELEANAPRRPTNRPSTMDLVSVPQKRLFRDLKIHLRNNNYSVFFYFHYSYLHLLFYIVVIINLGRLWNTWIV